MDPENSGGSSSKRSGEVTYLLDRWQKGDDDAFETLLPIVYAELRRIAGSLLRKEREGHTLQATALVNEAYLRLVGRHSPPTSKAHFFAVAAQAMRRVLVDHARRYTADKRIGASDKITLIEAVDTPDVERGLDADVLALHESIDKLDKINPRQAKLIELRYFGGLSREEIADVLGISVRSVAREWHLARMMLRHWLTDGNRREPGKSSS